MLKETAGHTRMFKWSLIGAAHWFVMVGFLVLFLLVVEAYFEVVTPTGELPIIGHWLVFGFATEWIGILGIAGIVYLMAVRLANRRPAPAAAPASPAPRCGRATSSSGSCYWS